MSFLREVSAEIGIGIDADNRNPASCSGSGGVDAQVRHADEANCGKSSVHLQFSREVAADYHRLCIFVPLVETRKMLIADRGR